MPLRHLPSVILSRITSDGYEYVLHSEFGFPKHYDSDSHETPGFEQILAKEMGVDPNDILAANEEYSHREITQDELADILSSTVKEDRTTKLLAFYAYLCTYTEDSQMNIGFESSSSTGKSYIALELAAYFPKDDVIIQGYTSPTAFFHDGVWDEKEHVFKVLLERKLLIFVDQPHFQLQERLRPLLSHDKKEIIHKITNRNQKSGLKTKTVIVRGYPTTVFCTTMASHDEQENTRLLILSPESTHGKLEKSISLTTLRKGDSKHYKEKIRADPRRKLLTQRVVDIKNAGINDVFIQDAETIAQRFKKLHEGKLVPRHQRDIERLISFIKANAILNFRQRERLADGRVKASKNDADAGFSLYNLISESNELGISEEVYRVFKEIVEPLWNELEWVKDEKGVKKLGKKMDRGIRFEEIQKQYFERKKTILNPEWYRKILLPSWRAAGLVRVEEDPHDRRKQLLFPPLMYTQVESKIDSQSNYIGTNMCADPTQPPPTSQDKAPNFS